MAEIALVSIRKSRLQKEANEGNDDAQIALAFAKNPPRFLSTVQIGITFIGILTGALGGETLAWGVANWLKVIPFLASYSYPIALFLVVVFITYLSLVIGELVPKRIALTRPEKIAKIIARPMQFLASIIFPLVNLLTYSSDFLIRLLGIKPSSEPSVSEEEVKSLLQEGTLTGVFNRQEKDIVERTFQLDDKKIISFMTPRKEITWLDIDSSFKDLHNVIGKSQYSYYPVCRDGLDKVLGVVRTKDLLASLAMEQKIDLTKSINKPLYVPETMEALKVLEVFKRTGMHMAFVVDEYGSILGLLSLSDILEEIVGDIPDADELEDQEISKRKDGTFLVDGLISIDEFKKYFKLSKLPGENTGAYHTFGGFVMDQLDRIPNLDDTFEFEGLRFKVFAMDGNRVEKVLIEKLNEPS